MFKSRILFAVCAAVAMVTARVAGVAERAFKSLRAYAETAFLHVAAQPWAPSGWQHLARKEADTAPTLLLKQRDRDLRRRPTVFPAWRMCASG